jgi:hydrogenase/urease accessory protein HupE
MPRVGWQVHGVAIGMVLAASGPVDAHPMPGVSDFYAGMLHPVTTTEFLLPLLALSLFAGQQQKSGRLLALVLVPCALLVGAAGALLTAAHLPLEPLAFAAMMLLGTAVALDRSMPIAVVVALVLFPAAVVGWSNGAEIDAQMSAWRFVAGLLLLGTTLVAYGIGLRARFDASWVRIACRVLGSWIAATGLLAQSLL